MALVAITKATCPETRAGIRRLYVTQCAKVQALTFDTDGSISAITMASSGDKFVPIDFQLNTAFFNQEKKRANGTGSITVTQTIEFSEEGIEQATLKALEALNGNDGCCLHGIVKDNRGKLWYAGISRDGSGFLSEDMRTGDGSANTGSNPENDTALTKETLVCKTRWYAPAVTVAESAIPV